MAAASDGKAVEVDREIVFGNVSVRGNDEVDLQVSTAKAYPRAVSKFKAQLETWATGSEEAAEACIFALPRAGKTIEGASIRFAELALASWGNARVRARIIDAGMNDPQFVTVEGAFWDLESNAAVSKEVRRRITDKEGRRFNADMIGITINAASSIAIRNATLAGIPRALWEPVYLKARQVVAGDVQTIANQRSKAIEYLSKFGVTEEMILATVGRAKIEDLDADDIVSLRASARQIRDGEAKVEDAFIDPKREPVEERRTSGMAGLKAAVPAVNVAGGEAASAGPGGVESGGSDQVSIPGEVVVPGASEASPLFGAPESGKKAVRDGRAAAAGADR